MPLFYVKITAPNGEAMFDLVRKYKITVASHTAEKTPSGYLIYAQADGKQIRRLEAAGYGVERLEDAGKAGKTRQEEVRKFSRKPELTVEDLTVAGISHYLSVVDVEKALAAAAVPPNDTFVKLIKLPNKTWENRECSALKIGKGSGRNRPGIYFLGGVHAREWGSPDILINFVLQLMMAYRNKTDITIGSSKFTAAQIQNLVNGKDIYVFPQVNPDGRNYSMTKDAMWRKNRRPSPAGLTKPSCVGVDINRNFDFLWDYPQYFAPSAPVQNSKDPSNYQVYIGPGAVSEPETKNAVWMFDNHPNIRYFIDLHSYSEAILYNWGDDEDQSTDPTMNFQNPAFNGKRGIAGDIAYKEFIPGVDKTTAVNLANTLRNAIKAVRGRTYLVEQSVGLYPTAGVSTDYAFARYFVNPGRAKVSSFTIEWGSPANPTPFHPAYTEMQKIIQEITSALLAFCIAAS
jgi:carboxypeptidase T